ncbi:MAG: PQQ-binding-like beta-propeller repeat protein [Chthoniobacteraceae bacterium]
MHTRNPLLRLVLPAALIALTFTATAQEWTRFRGPNGSGLANAKLPEQITEKDINWRCTLPGTGHSSPVVWGDRIFVTATPAGSPDSEAKRIIVCVGAKDGKIQWQREYATGIYRKHADNSFASPSCTVDAERVFVWIAGPDKSQLIALSQADGKQVWSAELGPFKAQHGPGASPIVEKGEVILQSSQDEPGSFIGAWNAATGKQLWKDELKGGQHAISTPCFLAGQSGLQLISLSTDNGLLGLDPATGKTLWGIPDIFHLRCVASPVITSEGMIVAQCGQGQAASEIQVIKGAATKQPAKAYDIVRIGGYVPTPIVVGDLLFLWKENGTVTCVRSKDGEQIWSERVEGPYYSSPICVGGKGGRLYNLTRSGELVVIAAAEKFRLIQRFPFNEKNSYATPAVSGGHLYVRTYSQLISIGK